MPVSFITITLLSTVQNIAAQPRHLTVIYGVNREVIINRLCWHPSYHNIYYNDTKRNIIYCRFATFGNIAIWIAIIINICCVYTMMMIRRRRKRNRRRKRRRDGWWMMEPHIYDSSRAFEINYTKTSYVWGTAVGIFQILTGHIIHE